MLGGGPDDTQRKTCGAYWKTPTVSWDGKVMLCGQDTQQTVKVGEVVDGSLSEAWWTGDRMQQIRKQALREDLTGLIPCRGCHFPYSPHAAAITADEVESWSASQPQIGARWIVLGTRWIVFPAGCHLDRAGCQVGSLPSAGAIQSARDAVMSMTEATR